MKNNIIIILVSLLLIVGLGFSLRANYRLYQRLNTMTENFDNLGVENSTLKLSVKDLNIYLDELNTNHKIVLDSVIRGHNIKIRNIINYQHIKVENIDVDTSKVVLDTPTIINDTTYQINFLSVRECFKIEGFIESKDCNSTATITRTEGVNNIYIIKSYKKTFWDWLFVRKGKEIITTSSDCGSIVTDEIKIGKD